MFYSEMTELPLHAKFIAERGIINEDPTDAVLELVLHVNQSGWGHIPTWEYPYFDVIIDNFTSDLITYEDFLEEIIDTCREIYNDPDYEGDVGMYQFESVLKDAAVMRGEPDRFAV